MYNLDNKMNRVFCMFLSFHSRTEKKMLFPKFIYKVERNKKSGYNKCVEVKSFLYKIKK